MVYGAPIGINMSPFTSNRTVDLRNNLVYDTDVTAGDEHDGQPGRALAGPGHQVDAAGAVFFCFLDAEGHGSADRGAGGMTVGRHLLERGDERLA